MPVDDIIETEPRVIKELYAAGVELGCVIELSRSDLCVCSVKIR